MNHSFKEICQEPFQTIACFRKDFSSFSGASSSSRCLIYKVHAASPAGTVLYHTRQPLSSTFFKLSFGFSAAFQSFLYFSSSRPRLTRTRLVYHSRFNLSSTFFRSSSAARPSLFDSVPRPSGARLIYQILRPMSTPFFIFFTPFLHGQYLLIACPPEHKICCPTPLQFIPSCAISLKEKPAGAPRSPGAGSPPWPSGPKTPSAQRRRGTKRGPPPGPGLQ